MSESDKNMMKKRNEESHVLENILRITCIESSLSSVQRGNLLNFVVTFDLDEQKSSYIAEFGSSFLNLDKYFIQEYFEKIREIIQSNNFEEIENLCYLPIFSIYSKVNGDLAKDTISKMVEAIKRGGIDKESLSELENIVSKFL